MGRSRLIRELRRRHVFRVAIAYAVVGWALIEVGATIIPALHLPDALTTVIVVFVMLGFPVAMVLAWAFEMTPSGVRRTVPEEAPDARPLEHHRHVGRKLDFLIIAVLGLAVSVLLWQRYGPGAIPEEHDDLASGAAGAPAEKAIGATPGTSSKSIAVLPFVNMSEDPTQDYFSDGIAEELLNRLAQLPDLKVAARTSAFQFKGKNQDIGEIGRKLNVAHVLEGSVRKSGTTLRITAQLIDSRSGYHLWSESFDRDATDVFKVQDEIAEAIADALEARIGTNAASSPARTANPAAYDDYLRARTYVARRRLANLDKAIAAFDRAISKDPGYSAAYSGRAFAYLLRPLWDYGDLDGALRDAGASAGQALELDPDNPEAYMVRGMVAYFSGDPDAAAANLDRAKGLAPGNVDILNMDGDFRIYVGALGEAEREKREAMSLDPLAFVHPLNLADVLMAQNRFAEAVDAANQAVALGVGAYGYDRLVFANARLGRVDATRVASEKACAGERATALNCATGKVLLLLAQGRREEARSLLDEIMRTLRDDPTFDAGSLAGYYLEIGDLDAVVRWEREAIESGSWAMTNLLLYAPGGAKLPEEISLDPAWLAVWSDPRVAKLTEAYRRNLLAWRRATRTAPSSPGGAHG